MTTPLFNFGDFTANGIASDLYGYGLGLGLSSNQSALNASQIAAPMGTINNALNSSLLGTGADMGPSSSLGAAQSILSAAGGIAGSELGPLFGLGSVGAAAGASVGAGQSQALTDTLSSIGIGRIATILSGLLLIAFGLYAFASSSITSAISSLAQKVTA